MSSYRQGLLQGSQRIGVWGTGHIGYSTICHFAEKGVRGIGMDVDEAKVACINRGENPIFAMDYWLGFRPGYLFETGTAQVTADWQELAAPDVGVHFVCIPTERDGLPYLDILGHVIRNIVDIAKQDRAEQPLVIIESTLTPNTTDDFVLPLIREAGLTIGGDIRVGCAPRRDWFATPDKSLRTLPRVVGGTDEATTQAMVDVLGIVCENLIPAPDHLHAEVVKSIENAYRHMEIGLANELTLAYPHMDIRTVLELVGTKWNVGTFFPSFGVGGYCIPLASHYVLEGARRPEHLSLLRTTIETSEAHPARVAQQLIQRRDIRSVGFLGLSYTKNVRVSAQSPALKMIPVLKEAGVSVRVNDPHFSAAEIEEIAGVETFEFPDDLGDFDAVLVVASHREYEAYPHARILDACGGVKLVLDNMGLWRHLDFSMADIEYHLAGDRFWLGRPADAGADQRASGSAGA